MSFPSMTGQYETAYEVGQRRGKTDSVVCCICGAFVIDVEAHDRWHTRMAHQRRLRAAHPEGREDACD